MPSNAQAVRFAMKVVRGYKMKVNELFKQELKVINMGLRSLLPI